MLRGRGGGLWHRSLLASFRQRDLVIELETLFYVGGRDLDVPGASPASSRTRIPARGGGDVMMYSFQLRDWTKNSVTETI